MLAIDVSRSIDDEEYALQMAGYANAFRNAKVVEAIETQPGGIVVTMVQWGDGGQQTVTVPWHPMTNGEDASVFARRIEQAPRARLGHATGLAQALGFSSKLFRDNGYRGRRLVIDISGDGRDNVGPFPIMVRDGLISQGITINGLAILNEDATLKYYYESVVAGGEQSFVESAEDYVDFAAAIVRKLVREISNNTVSQAPDGDGMKAAFLQRRP